MKKIKISTVDKSIPKKEFDILISTLAKLFIQKKQNSNRINEKTLIQNNLKLRILNKLIYFY